MPSEPHNRMSQVLDSIHGQAPEIVTRRGMRGIMTHGLWVPLPIMGGDGTDDGDGDPPPGGDDGANGGDGEKDTFDKDRAMATIQKLRGFEKLSKDQAKELEGLKAKVADFEKAQLSETERLQKERDDAQAKLAETESRARQRVIHSEVRVVAASLGFADAEDAWRFIDQDKIELDDDGEPKNVKPLLEDLLKNKPYLKGAAGDGKTGVPPTPKSTGQPSHDDLVKEKIEKLKGSGAYSRLA